MAQTNKVNVSKLSIKDRIKNWTTRHPEVKDAIWFGAAGAIASVVSYYVGYSVGASKGYEAGSEVGVQIGSLYAKADMADRMLGTVKDVVVDGK